MELDKWTQLNSLLKELAQEQLTEPKSRDSWWTHNGDFWFSVDLLRMGDFDPTRSEEDWEKIRECSVCGANNGQPCDSALHA